MIGIIAGNVFARFRYSQIDPENHSSAGPPARQAEMTERQAQLAAQMEQAQFEAQLAEQEAEIEILRQQRQRSTGKTAWGWRPNVARFRPATICANPTGQRWQWRRATARPFGTTPTKAKPATSTPPQR